MQRSLKLPLHLRLWVFPLSLHAFFWFSIWFSFCGAFSGELLHSWWKLLKGHCQTVFWLEVRTAGDGEWNPGFRSLWSGFTCLLLLSRQNGLTPRPQNALALNFQESRTLTVFSGLHYYCTVFSQPTLESDLEVVSCWTCKTVSCLLPIRPPAICPM